jgi:hypothetical protein
MPSLLLFQGFKCYKLHAARRGCPPECEEASEELEKVDVLRYIRSGGSGDHCHPNYSPMEEVTLEHGLKQKISAEYIHIYSVFLSAFYVVCHHSSIAVPMYAVKLVNPKLSCAS